MIRCSIHLRLFGSRFGAPQAELDAQALKQFEDTERDEACGCGLLSGLDQFGGELVTVDGVEGGWRNQFEVEEVIGRVGRIQRLVQIDSSRLRQRSGSGLR